MGRKVIQFSPNPYHLRRTREVLRLPCIIEAATEFAPSFNEFVLLSIGTGGGGGTLESACDNADCEGAGVCRDAIERFVCDRGGVGLDTYDAFVCERRGVGRDICECSERWLRLDHSHDVLDQRPILCISCGNNVR